MINLTMRWRLLLDLGLIFNSPYAVYRLDALSVLCVKKKQISRKDRQDNITTAGRREDRKEMITEKLSCVT